MNIYIYLEGGGERVPGSEMVGVCVCVLVCNGEGGGGRSGKISLLSSFFLGSKVELVAMGDQRCH